MTDSEKCCPVFDPSPYEDKVIKWKDKHFVKDSMRTFMHIPLFGVFGKTVVRMMKKIDAVEAKTSDEDFVMLCGDPSPWKSELFINVTKPVPGAENVLLSGTYLTKVYDAPFKDKKNSRQSVMQYAVTINPSSNQVTRHLQPSSYSTWAKPTT